MNFGTKASVSRQIVRAALSTGMYLISAQVLNEFSSVLLNKLKKTREEVDGFLEVLEGIKTVDVKPGWTRRAVALMGRYDIQFFDSLLLLDFTLVACLSH